MLVRNTRRIFIAAASIASLSTLTAHAQTSGSWIVESDGSWSDATKWSPDVPNGGGIATFETLQTFVIAAPRTVRQDLPTVTLDKIVYNTPFTFNLIPNVAGNTITLTGSAEIQHTVVPSLPWGSTLNGQLIGTPIAGSAGLTRSGPGIVSLTIANTYNGGTTFAPGSTTRTTVGDAAFGNASGALNFNDGTIRLQSAALTTSRQINLLAGGTFDATATGAVTINGLVTGVGSFNKVGSSSVAFTASNNYSGSTWIGAGSVIYSGNGAATATSSIRAGGTLTLDNSATNVANRLNDSAGITFTGSGLTMTGNAAGSSETMGVATFAQGITNVTVTPNAAAGASITFAQAQRAFGGAAFFRANSLGQAPGNNVGNIYLTTPPTLAPSGIIPWAYGADNSGSTSTSAGGSLVTYGANGVRPLAVGEYLTDFTSSTGNDNVRLNAVTNVAGPVTAGAVVMTSGSSIIGNGTISLSSGVFYNNVSNVALSAALNFGSNEGILHAPNSIFFGGPFLGNGGLTKTSDGAATFGSAESTYTGTTTVGGGTVFFLQSVPNGGPSVFGSDTSAIVLAPGAATGGRLLYSGVGAANFDRDLNVRAANLIGNTVLLPRFGVSAAQSLTMNGDISLAFPLSLAGAAGSNIIINGDVSGSGFITDSALVGGTITLNGNNTHEGGVEMTGGNVWAVGSDTAFGTGQIKHVQSSGQSTISAVGGARIVPNDVVALTAFSNSFWTIAGSNDINFTGKIIFANLGVGGVSTHTINNTALTTYSGQLSIGGFIKAGNGTLVFAGNNIYNGLGTVSAGVLRVTHSNGLGTPLAQTIVNSGAALEMTNNALSSEPVTISGTGISSGGAIRSTSGNNSLGPITLAAASSVAVDAGTLTVGNVGGAFDLTKSGPGTLNASRYRVNALTVSEGTAAVTPGRDAVNKVSITTGALAITPGASLDLGENDLIARSSTLTAIQSLIVAARNGGAWDQPGLTSNAARDRVPKITGLGLMSGADHIANIGATFDGVTVAASDVLVRYTYYGDTDFNGIVNFDDYSRIDAGFNNTRSGWINGDFDLNDVVNFDDYALADLAFNEQDGTIARAASFLDGSDPSMRGMDSPALQKVVEHFAEFGAPYAGGFLNAVPEPTSSVTVVVGAVVLQRRRRRMRCH